jgi:hypothetical protein
LPKDSEPPGNSRHQGQPEGPPGYAPGGIGSHGQFCEAFGADGAVVSGAGVSVAGAVVDSDVGESVAGAVESGVGDFWDASGEADAEESEPGVSVAGAVEGSDCVGSFVYWSWEAFPWANAVALRITIAREAETVMTTSRPMNPEYKTVRLMPPLLFSRRRLLNRRPAGSLALI